MHLSKHIDGVEVTLGNRFAELEYAHKVFDNWYPRINTTMDDFRLDIRALCKTVHRVVLDAGAPTLAASK